MCIRLLQRCTVVFFHVVFAMTQSTEEFIRSRYTNMSTDSDTSLDMQPLLDENNGDRGNNRNYWMSIGPVKVRFGGFLWKLQFMQRYLIPVNRCLHKLRIMSCGEFVIKKLLSCGSFLLYIFLLDIKVDCSTEEDLRKENNNLRENVTGLQQRNVDANHELQDLRNKVSDLEDEVRRLRSTIDQLQRENKSLHQEKENALTRLSEVAGSKLKFNNPGITDLSDDNRPNKLAEKFSELYDNEWTEAFESLEKVGKKEEEIIKILLDVLQFVYQRCIELTENQHKELTAKVIDVRMKGDSHDIAQVNIQILKKISDLQKDTAAEIIPNVVQLLQKEAPMDLQPIIAQCGSYFTKCVALSWMMRVQEPPVVLVFVCKESSTADLDVFRHYTKTGTVVQYLVWPAMLLHENGPLLMKGVFQPQ